MRPVCADSIVTENKKKDKSGTVNIVFLKVFVMITTRSESELAAAQTQANSMITAMPEMDGLEATEAIRALDRDDAKRIPIIALTANAFDEDVKMSLQAGMNAHLSKPVDPDHLFRTLGELIYKAEENR